MLSDIALVLWLHSIFAFSECRAQKRKKKRTRRKREILTKEGREQKRRRNDTVDYNEIDVFELMLGIH